MAWVAGVFADRAPRTRLLASYRAAAARWRGAWRPMCRALFRSAVLPVPTRNPVRGHTGEEPMTTTIILLTINSFAQLIAAIAQLIAALRRGP